MSDLLTQWGLDASIILAYLSRLLLALVVLWIGFKVAGHLARLMGKGLARAGINENLLPFLKSLVSVILKVLIVFTVASIVGVDVTAFVAVLAAAGFAVGLALQGSLSNFAAGIIILIFRPYKVGDWIEVSEKFGIVEEIQVFNTIMATPGQKTLIIPNGQVVDNIVTNYSRKGHIRIELEVTMPYSESFPRVKEIIRQEVVQVPEVLTEPEPEIGILAYDSHSIVVSVRPYVLPKDYWPVTFEVYGRIKAAFHQHEIQVAYSEGVELGRIGE